MKHETFGERLFNLRLDKHWTVTELSEVAGVSASCISLYERDLSEPRLFTALCLADALGVTLDYLVTGRIQKSDKSTK